MTLDAENSAFGGNHDSTGRSAHQSTRASDHSHFKPATPIASQQVPAVTSAKPAPIRTQAPTLAQSAYTYRAPTAAASAKTAHPGDPNNMPADLLWKTTDGGKESSKAHDEEPPLHIMRSSRMETQHPFYGHTQAPIQTQSGNARYLQSPAHLQGAPSHTIPSMTSQMPTQGTISPAQEHSQHAVNPNEMRSFASHLTQHGSPRRNNLDLEPIVSPVSHFSVSTTHSNIKHLVSDSRFHDEILCQLLDAARLNLIGEEAKKALNRAARARVIELRDMRDKGMVGVV